MLIIAVMSARICVLSVVSTAMFETSSLQYAFCSDILRWRTSYELAPLLESHLEVLRATGHDDRYAFAGVPYPFQSGHSATIHAGMLSSQNMY